MISARRRVLVPALVTLFGCGLFDESDADVRLAASAVSSVRLGDSVAVKVTIENMSDVPVTYQGNVCPRVFRVVSASGDPAGPPFQTIVCLGIHIPMMLAAGERHEYLRYWQARTHGPRFEPISVRAGRYRVEPVIAVMQNEAGRRVHVRYAVSTITVVE